MMESKFEFSFLKAFISYFLMTASNLFYVSACSEKETRIPIKQLGFEKYVYRALDVGFEFEYMVTDYQLTEEEEGKFEERFILSLEKEEYEKVFKAASSFRYCRLAWANPESDQKDNSGTGTIDAYICRVSLRPEGIFLGSSFKEDIHKISVVASELNQTGVF